MSGNCCRLKKIEELTGVDRRSTSDILDVITVLALNDVRLSKYRNIEMDRKHADGVRGRYETLGK